MPLSNALKPPILIDINRVKAEVENNLKQNFTWHYTQSTGSTNSDLLAHNSPLAIAITENQNQGRGQRNRAWQSGHAENLLFSLSMQLNTNYNLALTPIKVGIAVKKTLKQHGFNDVLLKWPNDIFYKHKKVGGILIESITQNKQVLIVIGVGLNINMPYGEHDDFIALKKSHNINRTPLLADCLKAIYTGVNNSDSDTVAAFNTAHLFQHKNIRFKQANKISSGVCQGINECGQLLIKTQTGVETHSTGSIVMDSHAVS